MPIQSSIEPFGHDHSSSKIERVWKNRPPGTAIDRKRTASFDAFSGLFYSPMEYQYVPISTHKFRACSDNLIKNYFINFVKGEFNNNDNKMAYPHMPTIEVGDAVSSHVYDEYLRVCEKELVYSDYVSSIIKEYEGNIPGKIKSILCHPYIGNKRNLKNVNFTELVELLESHLEEENRLMFVLPSFPFKDQNFFRTFDAAPNDLDMGEIALLIRLHSLSIAFYQVHPFGADWVILSDGNMYADIFGCDQNLVQNYFNRLIDVRSRLNLQGTVSIIDLREVVDHFFNVFGSGNFDEEVNKIELSLKNHLDEGDAEFLSAFSVLTRGMRQNINNKEMIYELGLNETWDIVYSQNLSDLSSSAQKWHLKFEEQATNAAYRYAAVNIVIRHFNIIGEVFPGAFRATVHAKKGQIAVPQLGSCFPWNGVSITKDPHDIHPQTFSVNRIFELDRLGKVLVAHKDITTGATLFYSVK